MIMLEEAIPEKRERSNHILSEMLFAAELDPRNVRVMRRILGKRVHIFRGTRSGRWIWSGIWGGGGSR